MIKHFRSLSALNILLIVICGLLLRIVPLASLPDELNFNFSESFIRLLIEVPQQTYFSPIADIFITYILVLIQAFLFNRIVNFYNLLGKQTYLPALLYVTTSSILVPFLVLSPPLICNFLLLWILYKVLSVYKTENTMAIMFDVGMICGVGTIIYFPFITIFPLVWICLLLFRPFYWRDWTTGIVGYLTIFLFLGVYYFWNDTFKNFFTIWLPLTYRFPKLNFNVYDYLALIPVIIIVLLGMLQLRQNFFRSVVQVRKSFQLLFFMLFFTLISFYLKPGYRDYHFILSVIPVSVMMAYYFLNARIRWLYEGLFALFFAAIIYFQLY